MYNKLLRLNITPSKEVITEHIINDQNSNTIPQHLQDLLGVLISTINLYILQLFQVTFLYSRRPPGVDVSRQLLHRLFYWDQRATKSTEALNTLLSDAPTSSNYLKIYIYLMLKQKGLL